MIEISSLSKSYGTRKAVDSLSLSIAPGEVFGFVGPNGAGKTSTIRMLATLLEPDQGEIRIAGYATRGQASDVRKSIGYMPDFFGLYNDMRVWEYLDFFGACYQIPGGERTGLIADLLELVELTHRRDDMVEGLSRGMQQRLSLARTLLHDPPVLLLDEPASGLDPRARLEIRELLLELSGMGKTVFFSTHILADVAEVCDRVGIIEAGRLVAVGPLDSLSADEIPFRQITITILREAGRAADLLGSQPGVSSVRVPGNADELAAGFRRKIRFNFSGDDEALSELLAELIAAKIRVIGVEERTRDLEQVFMQVTKGTVS